MNWIITSLAAAAVTAIALPAFAEGGEQAFGAFRQLCVDTKADYPAVVAGIDAGGWKATEILADTMKGVSITDKTSRTKTVGDSSLTIFAWRGLAASNVKISDCTMRVDKANFTDMHTRAQTLLGMSAQQATPQKAVFHYTDANGAHQAVSSDAEYEAAAAAAGLEILTVSSDGAGATLDLLTIRK